MNNQLIIDMIKTLASHLGTFRERKEVYDQLRSILPQVAWRYDLEEHVEIVRSSGNYRVFAVKDEWERDFRDALEHFWSCRGHEDHSEKVAFCLDWLSQKV